MDILHISDLHLTPPFRSFHDIWLGLAPHVRAATLDFIVVSGDLSQRAGPAEYDQLLTFTVERLLPLLRKPARERIVFVPGNHDVDWGVDIGAPARLTSKSPDDIRTMLAECRNAPINVRRRLNIGTFGHIEIIDLAEPAEYRKRFANVQKFLKDFYAGSSPAVLKPFDLLHPDPGHDWSAHVFNDDRVALFGFSSCYANDRFWTGAHIDPAAASQASVFADERARGFLRVAVWHHGLAGNHGSADYLLLHHLGSIYNAGFRVAFHGHTHRGESDVVRVLEDRIVVVATGSLGAGSSERPDAVGNQFSIVRLFPNRVFVTLYEREGATGVYRPRPAAVHRLKEAASDAAPTVHASSHRRTWTVRHDGVAEVVVDLAHVETEGREILLALLDHPLGGLRVDSVTWDGGTMAPEAQILGDGRTRYAFNAGRTRYDGLQWAYQVSNGLALNQAEFVLRERREHQFPNLDADWDAVSHVVRLDSDILELRLEFAPNSDGGIEAAQALVEQRVEVRGETTWQRVRHEEDRCKVSSPASRNAMAILRVEAPTVGWRYSLRYQPVNAGRRLDSWALKLAGSVLRHCRDFYQSDTGLSHVLDQTVTAALEDVLGDATSLDGFIREEDGVRVGLVWDQAQRRLLPAFGQFPPDSWSAGFPAGTGVAGHCLRFSKPVFWHDGASQSTDVIHQPSRSSRSYLWIICLPLEIGRDGPSIGVMSLAGYESRSPVGGRLFQLAEAMAEATPSRQSVERAGRLASRVNAAFWTTLSQHPALTVDDHNDAQRVFAALFPPPADA